MGDGGGWLGDGMGGDRWWIHCFVVFCWLRKRQHSPPPGEVAC